MRTTFATMPGDGRNNGLFPDSASTQSPHSSQTTIRRSGHRPIVVACYDLPGALSRQPDSRSGITDSVARVIAKELADSWKQPVLVDDRSGASGFAFEIVVG